MLNQPFVLYLLYCTIHPLYQPICLRMIRWTKTPFDSQLFANFLVNLLNKKNILYIDQNTTEIFLQYFFKVFLTYIIHKLPSLVRQDTFGSLELVKEFDYAFRHLSCRFSMERIGLWPFGQVVYHHTYVLVSTVSFFQFAIPMSSNGCVTWKKKTVQNKIIHFCRNLLPIKGRRW